MYSYRLQALLLSLLLCTPSIAEPLSPLAEALARLLVRPGTEVIGSNPLDWNENWSLEKFQATPEEIESAIKEVERAHPEEVAKLRQQGRDFRAATLEELKQIALKEWEKYPPVNPKQEILKRLLLFVQSQRAANFAPLPPVQLDVMARDRTMNDPRLPHAKRIPQDKWSQHHDITTAYQKHRRQLEEEEFPNQKSRDAAEEAFELWKREQLKYLDKTLAENVRQKALFLSENYPFIAATHIGGDEFSPADLRKMDVKLVHEFTPDGSPSWVLMANNERLALYNAPTLFRDRVRVAKIELSNLDRLDLGYGRVLQHPEVDGPLQYIDGLNEFNRRIQQMRDALEKVRFPPKAGRSALKKLQKAVQAVVSRPALEPNEVLNHSTWHKPAPGAASDWVTDLTWARMQSDPFYFEQDAATFLRARPQFEDFTKNTVPSTWRKNVRSLMQMATLAGAILLGHTYDDIYRSPQFQHGLEVASNSLEKLGNKASELWDAAYSRLPEWPEWATFSRSGNMQTAQNESEPSPSETTPGSRPMKPVPKEMLGSSTATRDAERPEEAHNKGDMEQLSNNLKEALYTVKSYDWGTIEGTAPLRFRLGYLEDLARDKSVEVPNDRDINYGRRNYYIATASQGLHIPTDSRVILPRPEDNLPKTVSLQALDENLRWRVLDSSSFKLFLTEKGTLYAEILPPYNNRPVKISQLYQKTDFTETREDNPKFFDLDREKLRKISDEIEKAGATKIASEVRALVTQADTEGKKISLHDIEQAFRRGSRYSFQDGEIDATLPLDDFARLKKYLGPEGYVCYQCDGASEAFRTFVIRYFRDDPTVKVARTRVIMRSPGEEILSKGGMHAQTEVWIEGSLKKLIFDATPGEMDPRDSVPRNARPPIVQERVKEKEELERQKRREEELRRLAAEAAKREADSKAQQDAPEDTNTKKDATTADNPKSDPIVKNEPTSNEPDTKANEEPRKNKQDPQPRPQDPQTEEPSHSRAEATETQPTPPAAAKPMATQTATSNRQVSIGAKPWWQPLLDYVRNTPWYHRFPRRADLEPDAEGRRALDEIEHIVHLLRGDESPDEIEALLRNERERVAREAAEKEEQERREKERLEAEQRRLETEAGLRAEALRLEAEAAAKRAEEEAKKPKPKPPAPEEILRVIEASRALEKQIVELKLPSTTSVPPKEVLRIALTAETVLLTGQGWDRLASLISKYLKRPVTIDRNTDINALLKEVREKAAAELKRHADLITSRGATRKSKYAAVHSPATVGAMNDAIQMLETYPWKQNPDVPEQMTAAEVDCAEAMASMGTSRYSVPPKLQRGRVLKKR